MAHWDPGNSRDKQKNVIRLLTIRLMKLIHFTLVLAAGILIGGILGWSLKPVQEEAGGDGSATALERQRPSRPVTASTSRFETEFKAIKDSTFKIIREDTGQDSAYLEALASALLKRAGGYAGLKGEEHQAFFDLLNAMAGKNLGRTLDWIDQVSEPQNRASLCSHAIQAGRKKSPVRDQLDLFKSRGFTADEIGIFAGRLMMVEETTMSTETALYLLGHVRPQVGSGYSGGYSRFDRNFDFAGFADATLQMAKANDNKPPNYYPMNFFSEWTRSDPQAAASFYFTHCIGKDGLKLPFNTLDKFMKELHANIPEEDYSNFAGTALSQQLLAEKPDTQLINELLRTCLSTPGGLAEKLNQIPDPALREKLIHETISRAAEASAGAGQDGNLMELRGALSLYNDPVARLGAVESYARELSGRGGDREAAGMIHNLCNQLAILGHSKADLQRVRNAAGKYGE